MKTRRTIYLSLAGIGMLWLLSACNRTPPVEPGFIRYQVDHTPNRIVNRSPDKIELLVPCQFCVWADDRWEEMTGCSGMGATNEFVPSGGQWLGPQSDNLNCATNSKCDFFVARQYRVPNLPGHTFVIYSHEGLPGDPSLVAGASLSISLPISDPFHFTIHSAMDAPAWLCWGQLDSHQEIILGGASRLERQTERDTWEIMPPKLTLCEGEIRNGIEITPGQPVAIDGTRAYPGYTQLPSGVYRWVMTLYYAGLRNDVVAFSPRFQWGGQ